MAESIRPQFSLKQVLGPLGARQLIVVDEDTDQAVPMQVVQMRPLPASALEPMRRKKRCEHLPTMIRLRRGVALGTIQKIIQIVLEKVLLSECGAC